MFSFSGVALLVMLGLGLLAFALQLYALVDAIRQRPAAFVAASKQTKQLWLIFLGVAAAIGFISLYPITLMTPLNFFNLIAVVAAAVYVTDVRPAVRRMSGGRGSSSYGSW